MGWSSDIEVTPPPPPRRMPGQRSIESMIASKEIDRNNPEKALKEINASVGASDHNKDDEDDALAPPQPPAPFSRRRFKRARLDSYADGTTLDNTVPVDPRLLSDGDVEGPDKDTKCSDEDVDCPDEQVHALSKTIFEDSVEIDSPSPLENSEAQDVEEAQELPSIHISSAHKYVPQACPQGCDPTKICEKKHQLHRHTVEAHSEHWPSRCLHPDCETTKRNTFPQPTLRI